MAFAPELQSKIAIWRQKSAEGTLTLDEAREFIKLVRGERRTAATTSESKSRSKAKSIIPAVDDLLEELGKL